MQFEPYRILVAVSPVEIGLLPVTSILERRGIKIEYAHSRGDLLRHAAAADLLIAFSEVGGADLTALAASPPMTRTGMAVLVLKEATPLEPVHGWLLVRAHDLEARLPYLLNKALGVMERTGPRLFARLEIAGETKTGRSSQAFSGTTVAINENGFLLETMHSLPAGVLVAVRLAGLAAAASHIFEGTVLREEEAPQGTKKRYFAVAFRGLPDAARIQLRIALSRL